MNNETLLKRICQPSSEERHAALVNEVATRNLPWENLMVADECMGMVIPASADKITLLVAHYDIVSGSLGYNDNGMALVTVLNLLKRLPKHVEVLFTN